MNIELILTTFTGLGVGVLGFFLRRQIDQLDDTRRGLEMLRSDCNSLALRVVAEYVKKEDVHRQFDEFKHDLKQLSDALFKKLDKIENESREAFIRLSDKIERKADKE